MFRSINKFLNLLYINLSCQFLRIDNYGNRLYLIFDRDFHDFNIILSVSPDEEGYLIFYLDIFTDNCIFD